MELDWLARGDSLIEVKRDQSTRLIEPAGQETADGESGGMSRCQGHSSSRWTDTIILANERRCIALCGAAHGGGPFIIGQLVSLGSRPGPALPGLSSPRQTDRNCTRQWLLLLYDKNMEGASRQCR